MKILLLLTFIGAAFALPQVSSDGAGRIVGGQPTEIDRYPYMAALLTTGYGTYYYHNCGGSLITRYAVLTAAHCLDGQRPVNWRVIVGSTFATAWHSQPYAVQLVPSTFLNHPGFSYATIDSDIAIITLTTPAPLSSHVALARIPSASYSVPTGTAVDVLGWGAIEYEGPTTDTLQQATINLVDQALCVERYKYLKTQPGVGRIYDVTPNMICAGLLGVGGKDVCQADSGGPLIHNSDVVLGITSWSYKCADAYYPGVYTRVSQFTQWIVDNAKI